MFRLKADRAPKSSRLVSRGLNSIGIECEQVARSLAQNFCIPRLEKFFHDGAEVGERLQVVGVEVRGMYPSDSWLNPMSGDRQQASLGSAASG